MTARAKTKRLKRCGWECNNERRLNEILRAERQILREAMAEIRFHGNREAQRLAAEALQDCIVARDSMLFPESPEPKPVRRGKRA